MFGEDKFLKIVEYQFCRTVFVTLYLVDDDFYFLGYFVLGESAVEDNVGQ